MLPHIIAPNLNIPVVPLTQDSFAPFGTVVENPANATGRSQELKVVKANQGSALKYIDVSHVSNFYHLAPSSKPARAVMNMFVCSPRQLESASSGSDIGQEQKSKFPVQILERHPFTPQTFVPLGLAADDAATVYLVIVAPTLPFPSKTTDRPLPYPDHAPRRRRSLTEILTRAQPSPFNNSDGSSSSSDSSPGPQLPKGPGEPDLSRAHAFLANGSQAVTYGPGTWHAPMVVLGAKAIDFVVVQYANDVGLEDVQEIEIRSESGSGGLNVVIESARLGRQLQERAKL
ncbi:MAG: EF-hand [Aureobasidium pullulans]|uniref:Ureidoglycolate hydrolase n=1 Tax=Aureobasidium pullulans TaxID=5580 RepID=A0A1A7MSY6_AURPU|nr:MAG: EF-hand [Aureobasidium pullulans]THV94975.1 ureidoglycolate hydrolase [Aureobasidium pullulans]THW46040.1 ureidoglycolate hydrolase [Aureobasidium pullulans]THX05434.1 ureidoglycolate hydrolase [Aureobasidium pullulans]THY66432.1 ureidoglycolate hydrolase [Aureobasidium pullulans]